MYEVFLNNFGYCLELLYATPEQADAAGRATGFEYTVRAVQQQGDYSVE